MCVRESFMLFWQIVGLVKLQNMTKIYFEVLLYLTLVARWGLHFGRGAEANEVTESLQGVEK